MRRLASSLALSLTLFGAAAAQAQPVQGFVDLHSHLMGEHAFGGGWFWGTVEGPLDWAMRRCDGNFPSPTHAATRYPIISEFVGPDTGWHLGRRRGYDRRKCKYFFGIPIPGTCPRPHFEDWPMWDAIAHQQMWYGHLQQARQGGLRVLVASLDESNFLCENTRPSTRRYDCDEMASVRRQAQFVRDFAARNASWVGIATTPAEARSLIAQGKLAVVLSVEVTQLFPSGDFLAQLDELRALGVRSVQVAHHADNRFAGAAPIPELIKTAKLVELLAGRDLTDIDEIVCRDASGQSHACDGESSLNERGLSPEGETLVRAMMDRGMLLDVAHLSRHALRDAYALAMQRGPYPLLYTHAHMWDTISPSEERHEKYLRADEVHLLTDTGGMLGLRTGFEDSLAYGSAVANSCQGSSRSFAQSLQYAVDRGLDVGFGADFNGFIKQMRPRYRPFLPTPAGIKAWCPADESQIRAAGGPSEMQKKGLAHVGLLPALLSDLQTVGLPAPYLDHLNRSAETFLRLWERSVSLGVPAPTNWALTAQISASSTYCSGAGTIHCYSPARANDGNRDTALGGFTSWANDSGVPMPQWLELSWQVAHAFTRVEVFTTAGYELRDYDVQAFDEGLGAWVGLASVRGNTLAHRVHALAPPALPTRRLRVLAVSGSAVQPGYARINELEAY